MSAQMTIIRDIVYGAANQGADISAVCEEIGIDPSQLNDSKTMFPLKPAAETWNVAVKYTNDPLLGLHLGEVMSPAILGMLGYLMQSSRNLLESFTLVGKYFEVVSTMSKFWVEERNDQILIRFEGNELWRRGYPESERQGVEFTFSGIMNLIGILSGKTIHPTRVDLAYPSRSIGEYERIFQSVIHFNSNNNALSFKKNDFLLPIISYDKSTYEFFNNAIKGKLSSLAFNKSFSDQIIQSILTNFNGLPPSIEVIASALNMTPRSIQRKLKEENISYREIVNNIKKELTQAIISQGKFRKSEVATMLGYSDSSAFKKALKNWSIQL